MIKILQFGEGNFLRAFAEHYIQAANEKGIYDGKVAICQPRKNNTVINALKKQNNEYNIILKGRLNGKIIDEVQHINCIEKCIDTVLETEELESTFCSHSLELIISNTTEAGICYNGNDKAKNFPNISFPAKITYLLKKRFDLGKSGLVFLPVELIENNGNELKNCILKYAKLWNLGDEFINFVESECSFCNTLVDRIVTGKVEYGSDACAVSCEPYASFIIEADEKAKKVIPFTKVDMGAQFAASALPFRKRKVKILNGVHTMSVLAGYNAGFKIVRDMVNDETFKAYILKGLNEEILETIDLDKEQLTSFAQSVIERFNNPFIDHKLLDISLNSIAKFKARCLCSYLDYYNKFGKAPKVLSFAFAGLINFYEDFENKDYPVNDVENVLEFFKAKHKDIVFDVLANSDFWCEDLTKYDNIYDTVNHWYTNIKKYGIKSAMEMLLNE